MFDEDAGDLRGADRAADWHSNYAARAYAVLDLGEGTLAVWRYAGGSPATLQWLRDDGRADAVVETPARYAGFDLVPNGRRLAFSRRNVDGGADGWVRDLRRSTETRLTFGQGDDAVRHRDVCL